MSIRIRAEKTSGATGCEIKLLKETVQWIADRIRYDCSKVDWIIYHPDSREEDNKANCNQAAVADIDIWWMDIRKRCRLIDFHRPLRNGYGYCRMGGGRKHIYISVQSIRLESASISVRGSGNAAQDLLRSDFLGMNRSFNGIRGQICEESVNGRKDAPDSLHEVVLHELAHIISGRDDDNEKFWRTLGELKDITREGSICCHRN